MSYQVSTNDIKVLQICILEFSKIYKKNSIRNIDSFFKAHQVDLIMVNRITYLQIHGCQLMLGGLFGIWRKWPNMCTTY